MQINGEQGMLLQSPVGDWIAAFNAHNVEAIISLYTDDAELFDSGMKHPRCGRAEIERWFTHRFQSMPSIAYVPTGQVFMEEDQAAISWTTHGNGPRLLGLSWFSRPFAVDGISVFVLRGRLICKQRGYYDHLEVVEQIVPPLKWLLPARL